jgi:hypothetical protein
MKLKKTQKSILNRYPSIRTLAELPGHVIVDLKLLFDYKTIEADIENYLISVYDDY